MVAATMHQAIDKSSLETVVGIDIDSKTEGWVWVDL